MPSQAQIRDEVTARMIEALEAEVLPWRRPWRTTVGGSQPGRHSNVASRKPYQGVNPLLLEFHALRLGLLSRWWGTFNQWHQIGCTIRKRPQCVEVGHWGCRVVFWKPLTKTVVDDEGIRGGKQEAEAGNRYRLWRPLAAVGKDRPLVDCQIQGRLKLLVQFVTFIDMDDGRAS